MLAVRSDFATLRLVYMYCNNSVWPERSITASTLLLKMEHFARDLKWWQIQKPVRSGLFSSQIQIDANSPQPTMENIRLTLVTEFGTSQ